MLIPSLSFFAFLSAVTVSYHLIPFTVLKKWILCVASTAFMMSFGMDHFMYLFTVVLSVYCFSHLLKEYRNPLLLLAAFLLPLGGLLYYKYFNFAVDCLDQFDWFTFEKTSLVIPVGISFYTFKAIGYLVDVYQGKEEVQDSFLNLYAYLTFFPQILSGPIQKSSDFLPQLQMKNRYQSRRVRQGFLLIVFGLFEKIVIAERLLLVVKNCFDPGQSLTPSLAMIGCVAYSLQIYSDFDGYSNLAIGMANLFGFECSPNFNVPYFSKSLKEFWSRWHISLSSWLKEYIYIPLGGNRKGRLRKYINLTCVFFVSGLWHGTSWNFVLWGLLNAAVQIVCDLPSIVLKGKKLRAIPIVSQMISVVRIAVTFSIVTVLWVFFRCSSFSESMYVLSMLSQFTLQDFVFEVPNLAAVELYATCVFVLLLCLSDVLRYSGFSVQTFESFSFPVKWAVCFCMILLMLIFAVYGPGYDPSKFIYIQF